jgi:hypothetical protein
VTNPGDDSKRGCKLFAVFGEASVKNENTSITVYGLKISPHRGRWKRPDALPATEWFEASTLSAGQAEQPWLRYGQEHQQRSADRHVFQEVDPVGLLHLLGVQTGFGWQDFEAV